MHRGLDDLPDEVLIKVISFCSLNDVISTQRTCKHLYHLCNARPIWTALLQSLDVDQAPDLPPSLHLNSLPTPDLKEKVLKAVRNSKRRNFQCVSRIEELRIGPPMEDALGTTDPRLLPGGNQVLLENRGLLELWSIDSRERLWAAPTDRGRHDCILFDFDPVGANKLRIAGAFLDKDNHTTYIRVFLFDFEKNAGKLIIERDLPVFIHFHLMIRGEILMVHVPMMFQVILVNWCTKSSAILDFSDSTGQKANMRAALIGGRHLVVALHIGTFALVALPLSSLAGRWSRSKHHAEWEVIAFISDASDNVRHHNGLGGCVLRLNRFECEDGPWILALHAFTPAWRGADVPSEIYVVAYGRATDQRWSKRLLSYRVQLSRIPNATREGDHAHRSSLMASSLSRRQCQFPPQPESDSGYATEMEASDGQCRLTVVSQCCATTNTVPLPWMSDCITNSGHMFSLRDKLLCFSLFTEAPQPSSIAMLATEANPDEGPTIPSIEPWSGALTIGTPGLVRIVHFN